MPMINRPRRNQFPLDLSQPPKISPPRNFRFYVSIQEGDLKKSLQKGGRQFLIVMRQGWGCMAETGFSGLFQQDKRTGWTRGEVRFVPMKVKFSDLSAAEKTRLKKELEKVLKNLE